jgi:hypothetical protein
MIQQVLDRLAEPGIRLRLALGNLRLQPPMQFRHDRRAVLLMKLQPLFQCHSRLARLGVVAIHLAQHLQHVAALFRKISGHIHKLPSSVSHAIGQQNFRARV